jgi:hypothetical protein
MYSGGIGSWAAAKRLVDSGIQPTLLFCDTLIEDGDLYRFLDESATALGLTVTGVADGRTPWQVFRKVRFIGNAGVAPCSHILKQKVARAWLENNAPEAIIYLGIDWSESHRLTRAQQHWLPWRAEAPLCEKPYQTKQDHIDSLKAYGVEPPRLYRMGFPHNNCGGFCVRAGHDQFRRLLALMPERYAEHEREEQALREHLDADVSILRDRTGGKTSPLTLKDFRERGEGSAQMGFDWGGCGCFLDEASA